VLGEMPYLGIRRNLGDGLSSLDVCLRR
jgi:hypothetical protein